MKTISLTVKQPTNFMGSSPAMDSQITELALIELRNRSDGDAARYLDARLRNLEESWKKSFIERGIILHEVKQRLLWRLLNDSETGQPYHSFDRWVLDSAPQSRSDCYAALKAVEELRDIPREQLENIPRCNISILQALSTKVRQNQEVMQWASTTSQKDFVARLEYAYPDQHIESRRMLHLNPTRSASTVIEQAIRLAMQVEGVTTREQALEIISVEYIHSHQEAEDDGQARPEGYTESAS